MSKTIPSTKNLLINLAKLPKHTHIMLNFAALSGSFRKPKRLSLSTISQEIA